MFCALKDGKIPNLGHRPNHALMLLLSIVTDHTSVANHVEVLKERNFDPHYAYYATARLMYVSSSNLIFVFVVFE